MLYIYRLCDYFLNSNIKCQRGKQNIKNVYNELKEYFTVLSCFGQYKTIQCDTGMCDISLCTHIYTYSEIKVFVFPLAKSKILEGVVTAKGVRSGSQVQVQVLRGRSFKIESTLACSYWAGSLCLKDGQSLRGRPRVGFNIIGPKALQLRGDAPLLSCPGALQHLKATAQRFSAFLRIKLNKSYNDHNPYSSEVNRQQK